MSELIESEQGTTNFFFEKNPFEKWNNKECFAQKKYFSYQSRKLKLLIRGKSWSKMRKRERESKIFKYFQLIFKFHLFFICFYQSHTNLFFMIDCVFFV